jgi:toxin-antitoxin system PIN domain toxin
VILPDVNVLVIAHRSDQSHHQALRTWWEAEVNSDRPFALADLTVAGYLRIVTNPRIFSEPTPLDRAMTVVDDLTKRAGCVPVAAGPRHWPIMRRLLKDADARGNLVPDAHLAAIAIEHGATVATRDRGFARFPGLSWFDPVGS